MIRAIRQVVRAASWVRDHFYIARELVRPVEYDADARKAHLEELRRQREEELRRGRP